MIETSIHATGRIHDSHDFSSEETAAKLAEIVMGHDLKSMADAIDYAADVTREPEALSDAELARLLYRRPKLVTVILR